MKKNSFNPIRSLIVVVLLLLSGGCSVLTPAQIREVGKFAAIARNYTELPGAVIKRHADIRKTRKLLDAANITDGGISLEQIETALEMEKRFNEKAEQADRAIDILNTYAELLSMLTDEDYTDKLQVSAEVLGLNLDNAINTYNSQFNKTLPTVGSVVAGIIRGTAGIYIKHKQAEILKQAITKADPVVIEMTHAIENLLNIYIDGDINLIENERNELRESYKNTPFPRPLSTVTAVADKFSACEHLIQLAKRSVEAAKYYREAHAKLKNIVFEKQTLYSVVRQIEILGNEVKNALELKKKLE